MKPKLYRSDESIEFLNLVKAAEEKFGMSRAKIAQQIGVSPSQISNIARDVNRKPGRASMKLLRDLVAELRRGKPPLAGPPMTPEKKLAILKETNAASYRTASKIIDAVYQDSAQPDPDIIPPEGAAGDAASLARSDQQKRKAGRPIEDKLCPKNDDAKLPDR